MSWPYLCLWDEIELGGFVNVAKPRSCLSSLMPCGFVSPYDIRRCAAIGIP